MNGPFAPALHIGWTWISELKNFEIWKAKATWPHCTLILIIRILLSHSGIQKLHPASVAGEGAWRIGSGCIGAWRIQGTPARGGWLTRGSSALPAQGLQGAQLACRSRPQIILFWAPSRRSSYQWWVPACRPPRYLRARSPPSEASSSLGSLFRCISTCPACHPCSNSSCESPICFLFCFIQSLTSLSLALVNLGQHRSSSDHLMRKAMAKFRQKAVHLGLVWIL
jgi:hypothetical protein